MTNLQKRIKLLVYSDVHLSLLSQFTCDLMSLTQLGRDTTTRLFEQLVNTIFELDKQENYDKIINLGDNIGHLAGLMKNKVLQHVVNSFKSHFTQQKLLYILGNSEGIFNYTFSHEQYDEHLLQLYNYFYPNNNDENVKLFLKFGYFKQQISEKLTFIALNNIFYCYNAQNSQLENEDTIEQYKFLYTQLNTAKQNDQQIIIFAHCFPGIDNLKTKKCDNVIFQQQFIKVLREYQENIICVFVAHYHSEGMIIIDNCSVNIFSVPSVSPVLKTHPKFQTIELEYEEDKYQLSQITTYIKQLDGKVDDQKFTQQHSLKISKQMKQQSIVDEICNHQGDIRRIE